MKIAIFSRSTTFHFTSGGMETQLKTLAEGLSEKGNEITVITTSKSAGQSTDLKENLNGVNYIFIGGTTPGHYPLNFWENIFYKFGVLNVPDVGSKNYFRESLKVFKELGDQDLIISQSTAAYGVYDSATLPLYSIIHGTIKTEVRNRLRSLKTFKNFVRFFLVDMPKWRWEMYTLNKSFFGRCDKIISVNETLTHEFAQDYPEFENKLKTIRNGVDTKVFYPGNAKYDDFTILYIGRMQKEKGVDLIVEAVKILKDKNINIRAKLIGDGQDLGQFKDLSQKYGLVNELEFTGGLKNDELPQYYQKCHVFVLPTRRQEGHPVTISESFCSGLPVICTKAGGLKDLIFDGRTGVFIQESASDLAAKIENLYVNRELLNELSKRVALEGFNNFSKDVMITKYVELLSHANS